MTALRHTPIAAVAAIVLAPLLFTRTETAQSSPSEMTVPPGFEIELVAGPPLVDRPIDADFDEQGRLYVADSSGSNDKVEKQLARSRTASSASKTPTATGASTRASSSPTR